MTGDAATELLREIGEALHRHESGGGWDGCPSCSARADVVLALPSVRRLLADRQAVQRCRELIAFYDRHEYSSLEVDDLRRALDGDS